MADSREAPVSGRGCCSCCLRLRSESWRGKAVAVEALKKVREWSELVAGPKWKTFIRRFNITSGGRAKPPSKFQYDPLSYALNFDDGLGKNPNSLCSQI